MKKKLLVGLSMVMLLSFAGCSGESGEEEKSEQITIMNIDENVNPAGVFPIVKEPITLKIMVAQQATVEDITTNAFTKHLEEKTGINIEWQVVSQTSAGEKLNVMLATGSELPDIFLGFDVNMSQQMVFGKDQGLFVNIEPYLEEYAPNIVDVFDSSEIFEAVSKTPDDQLYAISGIEETYHVKFQEKAWIREDYLEALDMELPVTTDDFKELLIAIRDNDPNGNGKKDEIPFVGAATGWSTNVLPFVMSAFIPYYEFDGNIAEEISFTVVDGKIEVAFDKDAYKQGLQYMNELVEEGLLDPVSFTQDQKQLKTLTGNEANYVGVITAGAPGAGVNGVENQMEWTALAPLEGPSGEKYTRYVPLSPMLGRYIITHECTNIAAAVRLADYLMSKQGTLESSMGKEGVDWKYNNDPAKLGLNGQMAVYERINSFGKVQNENWAKIAPLNLMDDFRNGQMAIGGDLDIEQKLYDESKEKYAPANEERFLLPVAISEDDMNEFVDITAGLETYLSQVIPEFIMGTREFDKWDDHIKMIENMGVDRLEEIINESYKAQYGDIGIK